jgi:Anti-sigma-K factor rskA
VRKGLRTRVLREVRTTPQDVAPHAATPSVSISGDPAPHAAPPRDPAPRRARRPWLIPRRPALALGSLAAMAVAVIVGVAIGSSGGGGATRVIQAQVVGASGSAQLRVAGGHGELVMRHMPEPAPGRVYEVWFQRGQGRPAPTNTLFSVSSAGAGDVGLAGSLNGISEVLVTQEPAGGSLVPTSPAVIVARLS